MAQFFYRTRMRAIFVATNTTRYSSQPFCRADPLKTPTIRVKRRVVVVAAPWRREAMEKGGEGYTQGGSKNRTVL